MSNIQHIPFSSPSINQYDIDLVTKVLQSGILSMGEYTSKFEQAMANYLGVKHAIAVSSGTAGLHLAVVAAKLPQSSEIITTPFSFIPSSNCILYGNYKPVFVDIELDSLGPDPLLVEANITPNTGAILFADLFHQAVNIQPLRKIADKHNLLLIEDACEALGAKSGKEFAGTLGDIGVFGFYPNKQITTGEGGMIVTNCTQTAELCRTLRNQGRAPNNGWLTHDVIGYNYRLNEMSAALGLSQITRIEDLLTARENVANTYINKLKQVSGIRLPNIACSNTHSSWFTFTVQLDDKISREYVRNQLASVGVPTRDYFHCIHLQKPYRDLFGFQAGMFPVAEQFAKQNISLPLFPDMSEHQIEYVCNALINVINKA